MTEKTLFTKPTDAELRSRLTPIQYRVTQQHGTEPPFMNEYWNNHRDGLYVDITTGEPLFSSRDKFDSGTGWPSFTRPVAPERVIEHRDTSHGMVRIEVRSAAGNAHLGHVFDDGPHPTGLRYCINSAALRFIPAAELASAGYSAYLPLFGQTAPAAAKHAATACAVGENKKPDSCEATMDIAILAGGCFWGMEEILRQVPGVLDTEVGYTGGSVANPTYPEVKKGHTGHAEAIKITFDPAQLSYADLLETWFFKMHDPTTKNRQGNDIGSQYRSAIFYTTEAQRKTAEEVRAKMDASGFWKKPIVTEIVPAAPFTAAEDYHQDYLVKNPGGYTCHFMRE